MVSKEEQYVGDLDAVESVSYMCTPASTPLTMLFSCLFGLYVMPLLPSYQFPNWMISSRKFLAISLTFGNATDVF